MMYNYHPWIEKIEYTVDDFAWLLFLYGAVILASVYYWDKNVYEGFLNER